ncbi:hypothetical protein C8R42DRAFT_778149 [Lentinula raphanica]|nr:hypothetical protein C8R42DRAFT_778149 [Lentinula raphanica]
MPITGSESNPTDDPAHYLSASPVPGVQHGITSTDPASGVVSKRTIAPRSGSESPHPDEPTPGHSPFTTPSTGMHHATLVDRTKNRPTYGSPEHASQAQMLGHEKVTNSAAPAEEVLLDAYVMCDWTSEHTKAERVLQRLLNEEPLPDRLKSALSLGAKARVKVTGSWDDQEFEKQSFFINPGSEWDNYCYIHFSFPSDSEHVTVLNLYTVLRFPPDIPDSELPTKGFISDVVQKGLSNDWARYINGQRPKDVQPTTSSVVYNVNLQRDGTSSIMIAD